MPLTREEEKQMIHDIAAIKQCLLGYNGNPGLVKEFLEVRDDHYKLKRIVSGLITFLAGSGLLVGGGIGINYLIGG